MEKIDKQEVLVLGGGIAGALAAVASARMGAKTLLVEETGALGGSLTTCGTGPMMTFHAGDVQVIRGLGEELIRRLKEKELSPGHIPDSTGYTYSVTPFDAEGMKRELELMVLESGAQILYHTTVTGACMDEGRLKKVNCTACGHLFQLEAQVFIDATGDGDLLALSGVPFEQGRKSDGRDQPMTLNFKMVDVDAQAIRQMMKEERHHFPLLVEKPGLEEEAVRLSVSGMQSLMRKAMQEGELSFDRDVVLAFETNAPGEFIVNMTRINGETALCPVSLSRAETEGRRQMWELYGFLKAKVRGFERARLLSSGPSIGIRSSRRMAGLYTLMVEDVLKGRRFEDGIIAYGYPVDVHSPEKGGDTDSRFLAHGDYYTVPYRCLINDRVPNLMAAGRNVSCCFEAQASLRTSPACSALGQAAGAAAVLSLRQGILPTALSARRLREELMQQGAFVPPQA